MGFVSLIVSFFTNLWTENSSNTFEEILYALPNDLPFISPDDGEMLVRDVTKNEVFLALQSLPSGKSPGPDGFNAEFYQFFWNDIGDPLFEAVKYFFNNSVMPKAWIRFS